MMMIIMMMMVVMVYNVVSQVRSYVSNDIIILRVVACFGVLVWFVVMNERTNERMKEWKFIQNIVKNKQGADKKV